MEIPATVTSKGQITIPVEIRKALGLRAGDRVVFRVVDGRAIFAAELHSAREGSPEAEVRKVPDFFDLAGSVPTPPDVDPDDWAVQREAAWTREVRDRG
jgi:AbrB family looped-hinge helix DNA binding protein